MKFLKIYLAITLLIVSTLHAQKVGVFYDSSIPQFEFAATDIRTALEAQNLQRI